MQEGAFITIHHFTHSVISDEYRKSIIYYQYLLLWKRRKMLHNCLFIITIEICSLKWKIYQTLNQYHDFKPG